MRLRGDEACRREGGKESTGVHYEKQCRYKVVRLFFLILKSV
jgi:hypothetical protein